MNLKKRYFELKKLNEECLILLKSGIFYVTFFDDALILKSFFSYQVNNNKIGFPIKSLDKVIEKLKEKNISYVIYNDNVDIIYNTSDNNSYHEYHNISKKDEFNSMMNDLLLNRIAQLIKDKDNYNKIKDFIDEF